MPAIEIILADDDPQALHYYHTILNAVADIEVVAETMVSDEVIALVNGAQPDVVLIDYAMYPINGFDLLAELQTLLPRIPVILLGGRDTLRYAALEAGASSYLSMPITPRALLDAIRQAVATRS